ncbi:MAG TPA: LuxR C-terminal-related transcriptional regulator [Ilumatobacteraceae bacterium]|jgi:DNA-binding CsgD family transcriptional regulator|nr:LuxR C-terminal-related transcriptional regulator [Ilumatobacteraceae bacterium]
MTPRLPQTDNRPLLARLEREWQALNMRPAVLRRAQGWGVAAPFGSLDQLLAAAGYWPSRQARLVVAGAPAAGTSATGPTRPGCSANEVLAQLVRAARTDDVAARVVLQRVLPGVVARARRWGSHRTGGSADAFDELLSVTWTVIREFPVERRPLHVAANLLRDSEYRAFERANRRLLVHELTAPHLLDGPVLTGDALDATAELAEVVAAAGMLTERELQLIELLARGCSAAEAAVALRVSERTIRNHRDVLVHRLRAAAMAA